MFFGNSCCSLLQKQPTNLSWLISRLTPDELEKIHGYIQSSINVSLSLIATMNSNHTNFMHNYSLALQSIEENFTKGQGDMQQEAERIQQLLLSQSLPDVVVDQQNTLPEALEENKN